MPQTNECTQFVLAGNLCTTCTGQPGIPTIPEHIDTVPVLAWNAGANTALAGGPEQKVLDGSLRLADFNVGMCGGIVVGIGPAPRAVVTDPSNLTHAIYLTMINGVVVAQPVELGVRVGDPVICSAASLFSIQRIDEIVTYLIDVAGDSTYEIGIVSATPSYGPVLGGSAVFASGDTIT